MNRSQAFAQGNTTNTVFTTCAGKHLCNVASGYWHVPLDKESSLLTTFVTPIGQFWWLRLPFGVSVSQNIFQMSMDTVIAGLRGAATIVNDMLIWGEGEMNDEVEVDHDHNLFTLMTTCRQAGIKLSAKKFRFRIPI